MSDQPVTLHQLPDLEHVFVQTAEAFLQLGHEAIATRGRFCVALSGGGTPRGMHGVLVSPTHRYRIDWSRVEFFWGDERSVPPNHPDANFRMAQETLLEPLQVRGSQVHRMRGEADNLDEAAREYQQTIADTFFADPAGPPPRFDLILLGMGDDGHTASLFPHTAALEETTRWVVANYVPSLESTRITMTAPLINRAHHVFFMATGRRKAASLAAVLEGPRVPHDYPSQLILPDEGDVAWYVDRGAASRLQASPA